jgi:hypothetical protein
MKDYTITFFTCGKQFKTNVLAANKNAAETVLHNKIKASTKIVETKEELPDILNDLFKGFN